MVPTSSKLAITTANMQTSIHLVKSELSFDFEVFTTIVALLGKTN
jgi:hypothetical protein